MTAVSHWRQLTRASRHGRSEPSRHIPAALCQKGPALLPRDSHDLACFAANKRERLSGHAVRFEALEVQNVSPLPQGILSPLSKPRDGVKDRRRGARGNSTIFDEPCLASLDSIRGPSSIATFHCFFPTFFSIRSFRLKEACLEQHGARQTSACVRPCYNACLASPKCRRKEGEGKEKRKELTSGGRSLAGNVTLGRSTGPWNDRKIMRTVLLCGFEDVPSKEGKGFVERTRQGQKEEETKCWKKNRQ